MSSYVVGTRVLTYECDMGTITEVNVNQKTNEVRYTITTDEGNILENAFDGEFTVIDND